MPFGQFFARHVHPSLCRAEKSTVFCEKGGRASLYMRVGAGKNPVFFAGRAVFCRPGGHTDPPPGTAAGHTFRLCSAKVRRRHTSSLCSGKVHQPGGCFALCREEVLRAAHFSALLWQSRRSGRCAQPPSRGVPGRGRSDPWVCLAETAPLSRVNFRQIRGVSAPPGQQKSRPEGRPVKEKQHSDYAECCRGDAVICLLELRF